SRRYFEQRRRLRAELDARYRHGARGGVLNSLVIDRAFLHLGPQRRSRECPGAYAGLLVDEVGVGLRFGRGGVLEESHDRVVSKIETRTHPVVGRNHVMLGSTVEAHRNYVHVELLGDANLFRAVAEQLLAGCDAPERDLCVLYLELDDG